MCRFSAPAPGSCTRSRGRRIGSEWEWWACWSRGSRLDQLLLPDPFSFLGSISRYWWKGSTHLCPTPLLDHHWWRLNTCSLLEKNTFESWKKELQNKSFMMLMVVSFHTSGVATPAYKIINCLIYWTDIILVCLYLIFFCACGFPTVTAHIYMVINCTHFNFALVFSTNTTSFQYTFASIYNLSLF